MADGQWFTRLPLRCLVSYIPYGMYIADNEDGSYGRDILYNKDMFNLMWRIYCDSAYSLKNFCRHELLKGKNVRYSGYTKMDYFYEERSFNEQSLNKLWKIPIETTPDKIKKVIIAPHYNVADKGTILYSTFHKNMWFLLYLAEKYQDRVSFIFKPHPNLRRAAVTRGLCKSYEDYDSHLKRWDDLPNAKVVQESKYLDHFLTSEGMITDSGSFLAEYLYTGHPVLHLYRPEQTYNDLGWEIIDSYYSVPGENYAKIEAFLNKVIIQGNDPKKKDREKVLSQEFDYKNSNGKSTVDFVCTDVFSIIEERV